MGNKSVKENNIHEIFSANTFVKVKPAFNIGRILFSFVETDDSKRQVKGIDCYLGVADAALLARKITSFRMYRMLEEEKGRGAKYPADVWKSPLGGIREDEARRRKIRNDGYAVSRTFSIAPGSSQYAVLTARSQAGKSNDRGLIIPVTTGQAMVIRVAVGSHDELEKLGIMLEGAVSLYLQEHCRQQEPEKKFST